MKETLNAEISSSQELTANVNVGEKKVGGVVYKNGDVVITSTNENPSLRLGGTWELIDKHFKEWSYYTSKPEEMINYISHNQYASPYAFGIVRSEHSVYIRYYFANVVFITDKERTFGRVLFEKFGIKNKLYLGIYDIPAGNKYGIALMNVSSSSGEIYSTGVVPISGRTDIPSGAQIRFEFEVRTPQNYMMDEHCDKFFWKKIA